MAGRRPGGGERRRAELRGDALLQRPGLRLPGAGGDEFLAAARAELARYCACPGCAWSGTCPGTDPGSARCVYGHCTWVSRQVSYACADRRTGACFPACAADEACYTQVACTGL